MLVVLMFIALVGLIPYGKRRENVTRTDWYLAGIILLASATSIGILLSR